MNKATTMDDIELNRAAVEAGAFITERDGSYGNVNAGSVIFTASEWAKFCAAITTGDTP